MIAARENPNILCSSISPGFIETNMTAGIGEPNDKGKPEEGTVSIRHCLFQQLEGNGWYYGSDGLRSPLDVPRDPGTPAYNGVDLTKPLEDDLDADLADIGGESGIDYQQSVETKGLNLGENIDDVVNKSMAMTEMVKAPGSDDKLFDKNNDKFEKYTDINEDQVEQKEDEMVLDNLGFMDEDIDFQPTELQKNIKLVKQSWAKFEKLGLEKCGQAFFRNIFKIEPGLLLLFSFKNEPKIYQSESFKNHAFKVMGAVDMAVKSLDDLENLMPKLKNLGRIHVNKGVKVEHYPVIGDALITTMKVGLKK